MGGDRSREARHGEGGGACAGVVGGEVREVKAGEGGSTGTRISGEEGNTTLRYVARGKRQRNLCWSPSELLQVLVVVSLVL